MAEPKSIVITFGRYNPPTRGHEKLFEKIVQIAKQKDIEHRIYPSHTQDDKKNPVPYDTKLKILRQIFPGVNFVETPFNNIFQILEDLAKKNYRKAYMVVGEDRADDFEKSLKPYFGLDKKFPIEYEIISLPRNEEDVSASKARSAAMDGDYDTFVKMEPTGASDKVLERLYNLIRSNLVVSESMYPRVFEMDPDWKIPTILVITRSESVESPTVKRLREICTKMNLPFASVNVNTCSIALVPGTSNQFSLIDTKNKFDGKHTLTLYSDNVIAFIRGGSLGSVTGLSIIHTMEKLGIFTVNSAETMLTCESKLKTYYSLKLADVPQPLTAPIKRIEDIGYAHQLIGKKYPVVVKAIGGAEGKSVSIVESERSLKSVVQTLLTAKVDVIIQQYFEIEYDTRTLVLDGKIIASLRRNKIADDFRTNAALGSKVESYTLSPVEKDVIKRAARAVDGIYVGVDTILVDGKCYVLEINGSPGSGQDVYMEYDDNENPVDEINGALLLTKVMNYVVDPEHREFASAKEIGTAEEIKIFGVGILKAKVDTGNGSWNVLDAKDISVKDKMATFTVFTGRKFTKPVVDTIHINIDGTGFVERPVVTFDVEFGGLIYKDVPFSLYERGKFTKHVLIGRKFLKRLKLTVNSNKRYSLGKELDDA